MFNDLSSEYASIKLANIMTISLFLFFFKGNSRAEELATTENIDIEQK